MSANDSSSTGPAPGRSTLRKAGLVVVGLAAVHLAVTSTTRILSVTLFQDVGTTEYTCRSGTRALYESVEKARLSAAQRTEPERQALSTFRNELNPVWSQADAVRAICQKDGDRKALAALRSVELLRYAEERSVRYNALDLTRWRERAPREVSALTDP